MKKKKYIVTLSEDYLRALYCQLNTQNDFTKLEVINQVMDGVKQFLYGDLDILTNFKINGVDAITIKPLSGATLKDLRKKGKRVRFV